MKFQLILATLLLLLGNTLYGQNDYPSTLLVEHFTNTNCPICAGENPGFYETLDDYSGSFIHIAYHPPVPYEECQFYQYNPSGNDARFNFYGLFGTPSVVLNGQESMSAGQVDQSDLSPYMGQRSSAELEVDISKTDPYEVDITIRTSDNYDSSDKRLFVLLVEERVDYEAPNGEEIHRDVFREFLTSNSGEVVSIGAGEEENVTYTYDWDDTWVQEELYAIAFIQDDSTNQIINAGSSLMSATAVGNPSDLQQMKLYPSPAKNEIHIEGMEHEGIIRIFDVAGQYQFQTKREQSASIDISSLDDGVYIVLFSTDAGHFQGSFIKE